MMRSTWPLSFMKKRTLVGGDPYFSNVVLLSGFEGADGSKAAFADESSYARTITPFNGSELDTAQFKFGSSSFLCTGSDPHARCSDSDDFHFGSGDFTVETFVRFSSLGSFNPIGGQYGSGQISWWMQYVNTGTKGLEFGWSANGSAVSTLKGNCTLSTGQWYHFATDRSGSTQRIYVDGSMLVSGTNSATLFNSNLNLLIGKVNVANLSGWIDEMRITKGVARYASDSGFTVPTSAYPRF